MVADQRKAGRTARKQVGQSKGLILLALLALVVALTGGASRSDAIQIVALRSLAALFLIPALLCIRKEDVVSNRALVAFLGCFVLLVAIQLLPLPPSLWQRLPGREEIYRLDVALGIEGAWRPLTFTPTRTWNVLGSLVVPVAGLLLAIAFRASSLTLLRMIAALGILNALLGLLQLASGRSSAFYLYELTNRGSPVGIFANENHASVFAACSMLVVAILGLRVRATRGPLWERLIYPAAFLLILLVALTGQSRAGFAASAGAVCVAIAMLTLSVRSGRRGAAKNPLLRWMDNHPRLLLAFPGLIVLLIAATFVILDRAPAFSDILSTDSFEDLRWSLWPTIHRMISIHWLLGTGLGSFEQVYHIYEPNALLMPRYVNQAHNDWVQLIIEGGICAVIVLIGLMVWIGKAVVTLSMRKGMAIAAIFWMSVFAVICLASLIDYPLRTPTFQLVAIWLLVALSRDVRDTKAT